MFPGFDWNAVSPPGDSGHIQQIFKFLPDTTFPHLPQPFLERQWIRLPSNNMESSTRRLHKAAPHQNCFAKATWLRIYRLGANLLREARQEPMQENESTFAQSHAGSKWFVRNGMKGTRWNDWYHEGINVLAYLPAILLWPVSHG